MTAQQPDALQLAERLTAPTAGPWDNLEAAAELRRLHSVNAQLLELLGEIGRANAAQIAPAYSELARAAIAAAKGEA